MNELTTTAPSALSAPSSAQTTTLLNIIAAAILYGILPPHP